MATFFRRLGHKTFAIVGGSSIGVICTISLVNAYTASPYSTRETREQSPFYEESKSRLNTMKTTKEYSLNDISMHNSMDKQIWVSFKDGVYDITDFLTKHVGGPKYIELAGGGRLEPFWSSFTFHLKDKDIFNLLEKYRIGNLCKSDQIDLDSSLLAQYEFANDPYDERPYDRLVIMRDNPLLSEAKNEFLGDTYFTPNELFYTRNHFPVPMDLNDINYKLDLHIDIGTNVDFTDMNDRWDDIKCDKSLSLDEIKNKFENIELNVTLQCSGNRGSDMREKGGLQHTLCENGFISNAKWKGVRIRDILIANGYNENDTRFDKYKYVTFYGYDTDLSTLHYAMSTPIEHIMNKWNECLLAFEMNDADLPKDHGYPLRVLLPEIAGCRSVKWLAKIQLTEDEIDSPWQKVSYKPYKHQIYDMPVTSVITRPIDGDIINNIINNKLEIKGFAWSGGGRGIIRVEVSINNGKTWKQCKLKQIKQQRNKEWSWTLWNIHIDLNNDVIEYDDDGNINIMCRALDSSFNSQPKNVDDVLNGTMYVNNSWHSINVKTM